MMDPGAARLPVLLYHKVDRRFEFGGTWVTPTQFEGHVRTLLERGYRFCALEELVSPDDRARPGDRRVAIAFDDGYRALEDFAFPVLREYGVPASVFVVTGFIGKDNLWDVNVGWRRFDHMGWREMEAALAHGVRFHSHTHTHRDLTRLNEAEARRELTLSRDLLERRLSQKVRYVSYPFGIYDANVARWAEESGYEAGFTLFGRAGQNVKPLYRIERSAVYRIDTRGSVVRKLEGGPLARVERIRDRVINRCAGGTPVAKRILGRKARGRFAESEKS
ncbi:MAG: polysaccharide deacetylase family protein [Candidatus Eisenbacteria bacterium]